MAADYSGETSTSLRTRRERRNIPHNLWVNSLHQRKIVGNHRFIGNSCKPSSVDAKLAKNLQWVFLDPGPCAMRGAFLEPRDSPFIAVQEMLSANNPCRTSNLGMVKSPCLHQRSSFVTLGCVQKCTSSAQLAS